MMSVVARNLAKLACPACRGAFALEEYPPTRGDSLFGVLVCDCFAYPILDSVPILLRESVAQFSFGTGEVESEGPQVSQIVMWIREGKGMQALAECLSFTPEVGFLNRLPLWRLWHSRLVLKLTRRWIRRRVDLLLRARGNDTAEDWLALYFRNHAAENAVLFDYYKYRFTLPRTMATYAVLELFPAGETLLDIACGFGPFPHYLSRRSRPSSVIGFDFNFYLVWWQRRFLAPDQLFLCADADDRLPFASGVFGGAYCSDSFMFMTRKRQLLKEIERCAPGRPLALTRLGNSKASPKNWGAEMSPPQYSELLGDGAIGFRESDLVRFYLHGTNPLQYAVVPLEELEYDKWLYFISKVGNEMREFAPSGPRPHEVGQATLNPILTPRPLDSGEVQLGFAFPSMWFAYQNADMYSYHADKLKVSAETLGKLQREGAQASEYPDFSRRFVIIGVPSGYLKRRH